MAGEWVPIRLGEVCIKIGSGATPRGGSDVYLEDGPFALIRSQNVYNDGFHHDGLAFIGERHAAELAGVEVLPNDVLLNITGDSVARACQVHPSVLPARVNQHVAIVRPDPERLDPRFLRYFLVSPEMQAKLLSWAGSGGTRNALTKGMIEGFAVTAPESIDEQRAIAHILGSLDDKIELNRRMSATLEAMARALFKAWFVDFEPVHAKAEGRDPGLPPQLATLFPDRLIEVEQNEIPNGWRESTIGEEVRVIGGSTPSTKNSDYWDGDINWATPKDLSALTAPVLLDTGRKISEAGLAKIGSGLLPAGTVLLSSRAPIGYLAIAEIPVAINQGFIAMVSEQQLSNVYVWLWTSWNMPEILAKANGSTFQEVSKGSFRPLPIVVPPEPVSRAFDAQAKTLYGRIAGCEREKQALVALRDTLLPRLISGDLHVMDAETFLDRVL